MKKVLLIGNMNNSFFSIARYLRDAGYNAKLLLMRNEPEHFHPDNDTFNTDYEQFIKKINWSSFPTDFVRIKKEDILKEVEGFDVIIGSNAAPAYLNKIGRRVDILVPHGSDLLHYPFIRWRDVSRYKYKLFRRMGIAKHQKEGINKAKFLLYEYTNEGYEKVISKRFKLTGERIPMTVPFLYYPEYMNASLQEKYGQSIHYKKFKELREKFDFLVFHHCGQAWQHKSIKGVKIFHDKGNDKVIRGFSKFIKETNANACLIMLEYSIDVEASKQLIAELGIENNVRWFPRMPKKEIMIGISMADVGVGEITHPWITYGVVVEFMVSGKPVIMNRNEKIKELYPEQFPHKNATNDTEVFEGLKWYYNNPEEAKKDGEASKAWVIKYVIEDSLKKIISLIEKL